MFIRHLMTFAALVLAVSVTACGTSAPIDASTDAPSPDAGTSPTSETGPANCDVLGTTCADELDTACDNRAICHCHVWMKSGDAKKITCDALAHDAGTVEVSVTDSGTDSNIADSSVDSFVADSGSSETTPSTETGAADSGTDTFVADTGVTDSGTADTSVTDTGVTPITGKLAISVLLPRWGATHSITAYGWSIPGKWTATGRGIDFTVDAVEGTEFQHNGFYDPKGTADDWTYAFCDFKTMTPKVAVWATFNGKPTARVKVVDNLKGGCNLSITAAASPLISSSDKDGDGFSPTDPDPAKRDCDDDPVTGNRRFPWQVETPEDLVDLNCDGWNDPPRRIIRMMGVSSGVTPYLTDALHWPAAYAMSWDSVSGSYQTAPFEVDLAPREFYMNWGSGGWDSSYEGGACKELTGGVVEFNDTDRTLVPVTLKVSSLGTSCHRFAAF